MIVASPACPVCGSPSFKVGAQTVRAFVRSGLAPIVPDRTFHYCPSSICDVVYFSDAIRYVRSDVRIRVGDKEAEPPIQLCYCFDWTREDIEAEIRRDGTTGIPERIKAKIRAGLCNCDTMNPRGVCCLASVNHAVTQALARRNPSPREAPPPVDRGKTRWLLATGAAVMSVIASACCWLPLLLLALGGSAAGISVSFVRYRPILLSVTLLLLGVAWIVTYRTALRGVWSRFRGRPAPSPGDDSFDATDSCCAAGSEGRPSRRFAMKRSSVVTLWISTVVVLAFVSIPRWSQFVSASSSEGRSHAPNLNEKVVAFAIEGMTCGGCVAIVESALGAVPGVKRASVDYAKGQALVVAGDSVAEESLVRAVEGAGFRVGTGVSSDSPPTGVNASATITVFEGRLRPLMDQFNADADRPRVLALLSPT